MPKEKVQPATRALDLSVLPVDPSPAYAPIATGARAIIRHVDDFGPLHNLESLGQLTMSLGRLGPRREEGLTAWQGMAA